MHAIPSPLLADMIAVLDWVGTFVFALSGGLLGVRKRFDLFGVLFLAFVVAVAGGMVRDVLIGAVPPVGITQIHYFLIAMAGGLITFYWYPRIVTLRQQIVLFDAVGLGLFAVIGAQKAIAYGINPLMASLLGMITGIGGGMTRDILAGDTPFVLYSDIYAVAALAGAGVVSAAYALGVSEFVSMPLGAAVCIFLRLMAIYRGWKAPIAGGGRGGARRP
ncbi:MAG: trimeric intracellular cation channel family protein [Rhodospirillales bacterium]|nr:trimeric intracellular cation channel family protein [Rhodospirillales bacterium]